MGQNPPSVRPKPVFSAQFCNKEGKMGKLVINQNSVTAEKAEALVKVCPFGAISYTGGKLDISSACKMCKMSSLFAVEGSFLSIGWGF